MDKTRLAMSLGAGAVALAGTIALVAADRTARAEDPAREVRLAYSKIYCRFIDIR